MFFFFFLGGGGGSDIPIIKHAKKEIMALISNIQVYTFSTQNRIDDLHVSLERALM